MDLSLVAAVGSFVVSERLLKPKATVLVILGFVLAYDLTTKTQDVSSLRVYRGPCLVSLTLILFAYSLRMWRRNGVACDELIFLPGTHHGQHIGIEGPLIESVLSNGDECSDADHNNEICLNNNSIYASISPLDSLARQTTPTSSNQTTTKSSLGEMEEAVAAEAGAEGSCSEGHSVEMVSLSSSGKESNDSTLLSAVETNGRNDISRNNNCFRRNSSSSSSNTNNSEEGNSSTDQDQNEGDKTSLLETGSPLHTPDAELRSRSNSDSHTNDISIDESTTTEYPQTESNGQNTNNANHTNTNINRGIRARVRVRLQRCAERYPHLAQLWTFFFNRSNGSNNANSTYAPSGPAVFGAALDLSMPVLFNFHVFIVTYNHIQRPDYTGSDFYAKTLPIAFLTVLYARAIIPPGRRLRFWGTMKFTFAAPFYRVGVRDEFIGDCLTSWVRIGQDIVFATIYFFIVIWGTLSRRYGLAESGEIMAESWVVHNVVLPLVAILPLWLKYLQTLRQAYDANRRWPYLGNAIKYLSAALVVIYGTTHPEQRRSPIWMTCFVVAVLYQIFWDVVMDWNLLEIPQEISVMMPGSTTTTTTESGSPRVLRSVLLYDIKPIQNCCQRLRALVSILRNVQLRQKRLYKTNSFYWKILAYNVLTRFTWMCCFIPSYHVSLSKTVVLTSTSDVMSYWGVLLPAAELFRRTLWGFLYLEKETIKMMEADSKYQRVGVGGDSCHDDCYDIENDDDGRTISSKSAKRRIDLMPTWLGQQQQVAHSAATTRAKRRQQLCRYLFLFELCVWAAGFVILGALVAW